ncbi:MAG: hypothetical protein LC650_05920 [Actinobacteria bacterium]|nr:hypothetical protein [Actinomycetota bacterium]
MKSKFDTVEEAFDYFSDTCHKVTEVINSDRPDELKMNEIIKMYVDTHSAMGDIPSEYGMGMLLEDFKEHFQKLAAGKESTLWTRKANGIVNLYFAVDLEVLETVMAMENK